MIFFPRGQMSKQPHGELAVKRKCINFTGGIKTACFFTFKQNTNKKSLQKWKQITGKSVFFPVKYFCFINPLVYENSE